MKKLRELDLWRVSSQVSRASYRLTLEPPLSRHFGLADQIRRAACSIPANIAEGYGLGARAQLIRCLRIALGSAYELSIHLEHAADLELADGASCRAARHLCLRTIALIVGTLRGLGTHFKP